jgi:hypothetical protein
MANVDFKLLREQVAAAARLAFAEVRAQHAKEDFYAFALYSVGGSCVTPSANSEQAYAEKRVDNENDYSATELLGEFRWSPFSWRYECEGSDHFASIDAVLNDRGSLNYDESDPEGFTTFRASVFAAMALALGDLEAEGFFGKGKARETVTVFCSEPDFAPWLEADSAQRLNPPEAFATFAAERLEYIASDPEDRAPKHDKVFAKYLSYLQKGSISD